ncbi:DUF4259 domain-containing protein [Emticicia agri]|uniref:DUF4259 domain-containing protein n=1 Tax=Emticicia agri TaxID=2492393 RepID=A0A4Q5M0N8_9BACT|nr:DUF4259 domain-containing protein [Emticicia agri]RYU95728.1 DUF4259 domain-containing protein [Emticicia agri]
MGAWGTGYFEDDCALDFVDELEREGNPKETINYALDIPIDVEYLGVEEGCAIIVSATYIDRQINGTIFTPIGRNDTYSVDTFADRHPEVDLSDLREKAIQALHSVLCENSELNELWSENEDDYPLWRQGLEELIGRLNR